MLKIAFFEIGLMGLNTSFKLNLWNPTRHKTEALPNLNVHIANTPAEAIADADITMLETVRL